MNDVFVTCIKNGRFDRFGRPLVSGSSYTLSWSLARDLWLSGYVSVTDASVFDSSSVDVRRPNLSAELAAIAVAVPIFQCGLPFIVFAGDGGATGLIFTGTAGAFTLSSAIVSSGTFVNAYGYLPENAGGLGNSEGWYYCSMSNDSVGVFYNNSYNPSSGAVPSVPASPTPFANPVGGRITQSTAEITCLRKTLLSGSIGPNGLIRMLVKMFGNNSAGQKQVRLRLNGSQLLFLYPTSSPVADVEQVAQFSGSLLRQTSTRFGINIGGASSSIYGDVSAINCSGDVDVSMTVQVPANTDSLAAIFRRLDLS